MYQKDQDNINILKRGTMKTKEQIELEDRELEEEAKRQRIEDSDAARDAQRNMAWFALFGMLLYPFAVVLSSLLELDKSATILGDMAPTYFGSVALIVAAFYAKEGYTEKKD